MILDVKVLPSLINTQEAPQGAPSSENVQNHRSIRPWGHPDIGPRVSAPALPVTNGPTWGCSLCSFASWVSSPIFIIRTTICKPFLVYKAFFNRHPRIRSLEPQPPGIILIFQLERLLANKERCHPACPQYSLHSICGGHMPFPSSKKDQRAGLGWWGAGKTRGRHSIEISPLPLLSDRRSGNVGTNG